MIADTHAYLSALGIPDFLHPAEKMPTVEKISTCCLVVEDTQTDSFCQRGNTQDFLLKMLSAIDLKVDDVRLINLGEGAVLQDYQAQVILVMGSTITVKKGFNTHHPAKIIADNTLKREAWEVLKQIQQCLK